MLFRTHEMLGVGVQPLSLKRPHVFHLSLQMTKDRENVLFALNLDYPLENLVLFFSERRSPLL